MNTYVVRRGTILEAIEATRAEAVKKNIEPNTLLLGQACHRDLGEALVGRAPFGGAGLAPESLYGMSVKWVPGNDVMVGNFVSLQ